MPESFFHIRRNRWWALLLLLILVWHGLYTVLRLHPHYLLFVCYSANFLLGLGLLYGSALLTGTGLAWTLLSFPLWLHYAILNQDWEPSGLVFHVCGLLASLLVFNDFCFPKRTWMACLGLGLFLQILARLFTDAALNVNAAFRIYQGWESYFPNYPVYFLIMLVGFGMYFLCLERLNRYWFFRRRRDHVGS